MTIIKGRIRNAWNSKSPFSEYDLILTDRRIIVAHAGYAYDIWVLKPFRGWLNRRQKRRKRIQALTLRTPLDILKSNAKNFEIPYDRIMKVEVRKAYPRCILEILYPDKKRDRFEIPRHQYEEAKTILKSVLDDCIDIFSH